MTALTVLYWLLNAAGFLTLLAMLGIIVLLSWLILKLLFS